MACHSSSMASTRLSIASAAVFVGSPGAAFNRASCAGAGRRRRSAANPASPPAPSPNDGETGCRIASFSSAIGILSLLCAQSALIRMPMFTSLGSESASSLMSSGCCVSRTRRGHRCNDVRPRLTARIGYTSWRVRVVASWRASDFFRSWRSSLCTFPRACVPCSPSPLVSVPPSTALLVLRSIRPIMLSNGVDSPFAASLNSIFMPSGTMAAASWPMPITARKSVARALSSEVLGLYVPRRSGSP